MRYRGLEDNAPGPPKDRVDYATQVVRMHLAQMAGLFSLGAALTFVMRMPNDRKSYLIVGDDWPVQAAVQKFITKKKGKR